MAINTEIEGIVALRPEPNGADASPRDAVLVVTPPAAPQADPDLGPAEKPIRTRGRRGWVLPVAIGAAALIASGTLAGFLVSTIGQRDSARVQVVVTQATLATTDKQLTAAHADAATRKVTSDYVQLVALDGGRVVADYATLQACNAYSQCRTAAQQTLSDLQAFQTQRAAASVPPALANADGELRDGVSAAIAAVQELITGADNNDTSKVKDGFHKLDAAVITIGKAEAALGTGSS
jgi:hypothetical protein